MADDELVKVRVRFREGEDLPDSETMWARPVEALDHGGTYELENSSFMVPLGAGDLVRAELDGDGGLQVTEVVRPADALLTVVQVDASLDDEARQALVDVWKTRGAGWTEGHHGMLVTMWRAGMSGDEVAAVLADDIRAGRVEWLAAAEPEERERARQTDIDFELVREATLPPVSTTYWVGDDPWWAEQGLDDPDFLAYVQALAGRDPRVARALENGKQHQVVQFVERLTAADPASLPPLDGPIFDD